ncbi:hypothetical protein [Kitasatospora sp. McL0602]|uniref:hypothetical protein n=1 Tax=Kitasatospora sp. McL0602 TaxID=3439530 RepID=UPI003F88E0FA
MKRWIKDNPVRARSGVVALLALLGLLVPSLAGLQTNETVIGLVLVAASLLGGHSAGKRVVTREADEASTAAALASGRRECCACPHALPEPNEPETATRMVLRAKVKR